MTALPVLFRDVRNEARRSANYWLRLLAASLMILVFWGLVSRDERSAHELGARLFPYLHGVLLITLWCVTPLLTADCLAQEKRDGTLPLLLLTRLTPCAVVTAKLLVHLLRGLTLVLAALPLLCLPFLTGGVSPEETKLSMLLCCSVLALGLTSGIIASAMCQSWARATVAALALSSALILLFALAALWGFRMGMLSLIPNTSPAWSTLSADNYFAANAVGMLMNFGGHWSKLLSELPVGGGAAWVALFGVLALVSVLVSVVLIQWSGRIVRHTSVGGAGSAAESSWWSLRPRFWLKAGKRQRRMALRRNPIFWLQQRTWSARATRWGWCLGVLIAELLLSRLRWPELWVTGQVLLGLFLSFGLIYAAASSYREERRNGMMELILVTPLPAWRLVSGRARSLWRQFLPAFIAWGLFSCFLTPRGFFTEDLVRVGCVGFTILLVTPGIGMEFAVNVRGHWRAVLVTAAVVLLVPGLVFLFALSDGWPAVFISCTVMWIGAMLITPALQLQMMERRLGYLHPHHRRRHHGLGLPRRGTIRPGGHALSRPAVFPRP